MTRRPVRKGSWRCHTCGETVTGTWASVERHVDAHGGGRVECVSVDPKPNRGP